MRSTRSPARPSVSGGSALADRLRRTRRPPPPAPRVRQRRGDHVAEAVGRSGCAWRGVGTVGWVEVDAAVVDAEPLCGLRSSHTSVRREPPIDHRADLGRAQPVDVDVGDRAARRAAASGSRRRPCRRRSGRPRGRDADRHARSAGQDEVEDRQVVRREVPEHVDVGLHQAEVDPHRVDELDVAELARCARAPGSAAPPACSSRCGRTSARGRASSADGDHRLGVLDRVAPAASRPARACRRRAPRSPDRAWVAAGVAIATASTPGRRAPAGSRRSPLLPRTSTRHVAPGRGRGRTPTPGRSRRSDAEVADQVGTPVAGADHGDAEWSRPMAVVTAFARRTLVVVQLHRFPLSVDDRNGRRWSRRGGGITSP